MMIMMTMLQHICIIYDDDHHHGWIQHKSTNRRFEVTAVHAWDHVQARMYDDDDI